MAGVTEENSSKTIQVGERTIHYHEAGSGYPIVMIHGSGPGATGWTNFGKNIGPLSEKYRVIALDLPGWGKSGQIDPAGTPLITASARAVIGLLDALGIDRTAVMGNSLGGAIALELASHYPDRISHLMTMGVGTAGAPNVYSPAGLTEGLKIVFGTYADPTPANFKRMVSIFVYDQSYATDELAEMRCAASLAQPENLGNFLKIMGRGMAGLSETPPGEQLAKLATFPSPALFIHGRDDRVVPMEGSLNLVSVVPNSAAHIFNRCGHWTQIEHADAFNKLVDAFLSANGVN